MDSKVEVRDGSRDRGYIVVRMAENISSDFLWVGEEFLVNGP